MTTKEDVAKLEPIVPKSRCPAAPRSRTQTATTTNANIIRSAAYIQGKSRGTNCAAAEKGYAIAVPGAANGPVLGGVVTATPNDTAARAALAAADHIPTRRTSAERNAWFACSITRLLLLRLRVAYELLHDSHGIAMRPWQTSRHGR